MNIREKNKLYYRLLATAPLNVRRADDEDIKMHKYSWTYDGMSVDACRMFPFAYYAVVFNAATDTMEHFHGARARKIYEHGKKHTK